LSKGLFDRLEDELEAREQQLGLKMSELLTLPEDLCHVLQWMIRKGQASLSEITTFLGQDEAAARALLDEAQVREYLREVELRGETHYCVRLAPRRGSILSANLWQALDDKCKDGEEGEP
jgi:hypothetical protein